MVSNTEQGVRPVALNSHPSLESLLFVTISQTKKMLHLALQESASAESELPSAESIESDDIRPFYRVDPSIRDTLPSI